jgi:CarD family transcriptional regulator
MAFDVGDKVVYPHHGAAVVERREMKEVFGETKEYLVLRLAYGDLTLMVPADNTDEVGLREVINDEEVEEVFAVLRKKDVRMPTNWSRRYKNHVEKLKSGDIYQVAEVVRNLSNRDKDKGLSAGEKRMLNRARQILVSELTFAIGVSEEDAEKTRCPEPATPVAGVGQRGPAQGSASRLRAVRVRSGQCESAQGSASRLRPFGRLARRASPWRPPRHVRPGPVPLR